MSVSIDKILLAGDFLRAVCPVFLKVELSLERGFISREPSRLSFAGADIYPVAAAETVEDVDSLMKRMPVNASCLISWDCGILAERCGCHLCCVENERADCGVRTDICTLVTLDTVLGEPFGNESCDAAFLICGRALLPCAVGDSLEVRDLEEVAVLSVDGTHESVDEFGIVVGGSGFVSELCPCRIDCELLVLAAAVNGSKVLVDHVLTFLAIALDDEFLHLLDGEIDGDDLGDAKECALEDGVGAVAQTNFLSDLGRIDIVDGDIMLCKVAFYLVGQVLGQLLALPDGVEQECAAVAETAGDIIHVEIGLYVACDEVGRVDQIGRADGLVAETQVRADVDSLMKRMPVNASCLISWDCGILHAPYRP